MNPANNNSGVPQPIAIAISSANCVAATGMSWSWVTRFARAHGVPIWRVGTRKQLIPGPALAAAMAQAAASAAPVSFEDDVAAMEREIVAMRGKRRHG